MPNAYPTTVTVNVGALSIEDVVAVARYGAKVEIAPEALEEVPAACERTSESCSWARISSGIWRRASAPKPVEMP